jgi:hypothetical protein
MLFSSLSQHSRGTYSRGVWNSVGLDHIPMTTVRVVRKGFCFSPDGSGPEEEALCSEAPDEDALTRGLA